MTPVSVICTDRFTVDVKRNLSEGLQEEGDLIQEEEI